MGASAMASAGDMLARADALIKRCVARGGDACVAVVRVERARRGGRRWERRLTRTRIGDARG